MYTIGYGTKSWSGSLLFLFVSLVLAGALLFHIIQRITILKLCIFENLYHTSVYDPVVSGAVVEPASEVCSSAMVVLPNVEN